jgi:hypothetical protein
MNEAVIVDAVEVNYLGLLRVSSAFAPVLAAGLEGEKVSAEEVARATFDGLERGDDEVLVDDNTRAVKAALSGDLRALYPELAA